VNEAKHSLLLLIPAYNEEQRIGPVLREFAEYYAQEFPGRFEIFVVLNGCRDNTLGVVQEVAKEFPCIRYLDYPDPIGKGGALIEGLKLAPLADLIGYVDADGATSPQAFHGLVKHLDNTGADCIIGSRWLPESVLHQSQTKVRRFISRGFHYIVEVLFWMGIKDTQCPAKLLRRDAVQKIHSHLRIADLAFDVNLLYSLRHVRLNVVEMPIEWTDKIGSKVTQSLMRSSVVMALSVVRLRLIYSPLYNWLQPLRPLEAWLYKKLRAPLPPKAPLPRSATLAGLQTTPAQQRSH
jgi:glycosyltransferase involved in cell wall biosynthesis